MFQWFGEINVFKHALAANGFFAPDSPRVTVDRVNNGEYNSVFNWATSEGWPITLHSDIGWVGGGL